MNLELNALLSELSRLSFSSSVMELIFLLSKISSLSNDCCLRCSEEVSSFSFISSLLSSFLIIVWLAEINCKTALLLIALKRIPHSFLLDPFYLILNDDLVHTDQKAWLSERLASILSTLIVAIVNHRCGAIYIVFSVNRTTDVSIRFKQGFPFTLLENRVRPIVGVHVIKIDHIGCLFRL